MTTSKFLIGLVVATGLAACDSLPVDEAPTAASTQIDPTSATEQVDTLATMLDQGDDVPPAQFQASLAPLQHAHFDSWAPGDVERLVSSFQRLRGSLVHRYRIVDPICTDDSAVRYSRCETGYSCVAAVQLAELHCLWFVAHQSQSL